MCLDEWLLFRWLFKIYSRRSSQEWDTSFSVDNISNDLIQNILGYPSTTGGRGDNFKSLSLSLFRQEGGVQISILSTFSMASNITFSEVIGTVQSRIRACKAPTLPCQFISNLTQLYRGKYCRVLKKENEKGF